jgi:hypothetical protein
MKKIVLAAAVMAMSASADEFARGSARNDGTSVSPHHRSHANGHRYDNYNSQGNTNPYTAQRGHQRNEFTNPAEYNLKIQPNPSDYNPIGDWFLRKTFAVGTVVILLYSIALRGSRKGEWWIYDPQANSLGVIVFRYDCICFR